MVIFWSTSLALELHDLEGLSQSFSRAWLTNGDVLLQLRPTKDLKETLLHEMIHAYQFLMKIRDNDKSGHGDKFKEKMNYINTASFPDPQVALAVLFLSCSLINCCSVLFTLDSLLRAVKLLEISENNGRRKCWLLDSISWKSHPSRRCLFRIWIE